MKSIKLITTMFAAALAFSSFSAQAEDGVENAFTDCGIGGALFPNNETGAIVSNIIWDLGTTALSSQISSPSTCAGANTTAAIFINETHHVLEEQVVKGSGDHLTALMNILGCDSATHSNIVEGLQSELSTSIESGKTEASDFGGMVDRVTEGKCTA